MKKNPNEGRVDFNVWELGGIVPKGLIVPMVKLMFIYVIMKDLC